MDTSDVKKRDKEKDTNAAKISKGRGIRHLWMLKLSQGRRKNQGDGLEDRNPCLSRKSRSKKPQGPARHKRELTSYGVHANPKLEHYR